MNKLGFGNLKGKVCVITGGAGVIGKSMCDAMASQGVKLAILDINEKAAAEVAEEMVSKYGTQCIGIEANVLDKESLKTAKGKVNEALGSVDFLVNGAGGNSPKATTKLEELTAKDLDKLEDSFFGLESEGFDMVFALNFKGTLLPSMVMAKDMLEKGSGSIINVSSMNSFSPLTKIPAYSAAKASINNFTQWLSVHLAKTGIRVNAIAPGFFLTNQNRFLLTDEKTGEMTPRGEKIINNTPMGKYGEPDDLQGTTLFLLSEMSSFITGIIVPVDGGYSAYGGV